MELDTLQIEINANASKANRSINTLANNMLKLSKNLGSLDVAKLTNISQGIQQIANASTGFKGGKSSELSSLAKALEKFTKIDTQSINNVASSLQGLSTSLGSVANTNMGSVVNLVNSVSRLGGSQASKATQNLPVIARDLTGFVNGMNGIGAVTFDSAGLSNLLNSVAKLGNKANTQATRNLPTISAQLQNFVRQMNNIGSASFDVTNFSQLISSISKIGGKTSTQAVTNLPLLASELKKLFTTLASCPTVNRNIIDMTNALANLASQGSRTGTATRSLSNSMNQYTRAISKAISSSKGLVSAIGMFYAKYFMVVRGLKGLWKAIESSMDYVEVLNYFNAGFGQVADNAVSQWREAGYDSADAYYDSFSSRAEQLTQKMTGFQVSDSGMLTGTSEKNMGINPTEMMNYQAMFGQMSSSMGITSENALTLSGVLTQLGADLASVKNLDFTDVWEDMASGLAGMSRTLDKYGVNIRNVNLQTKLNELGIEANITALNQNEKALLRTIILLDSTTYSWGDLADTINQPANQLRLLESNFKNLSRTIGNIFLPIVANVIPYINGLVIALQRVAENIVKMLGFGDFDWGGLSGGSSASDSLSAIYDEADSISGAMDDATTSAKALKNQLMGFDKVEKLEEPTDTSSTSSGTGTGIGASGAATLDKAFQDAANRYQEAWNKAFANMEQSAVIHANNIQKVLAPLEKMFGDIIIGDWFAVGEDVSGMATDILKFFRNAIKSVNWDEVGEEIGRFLRGIDWLAIFKESIKLRVDIATAISDVWFGSFETAPIETSIITALAGMKFLGLDTKIKKNIKKQITKALTSLGGFSGLLTLDLSTIISAGSFAEIGLTIVSGIIGGIGAAFLGFKLGNIIYEWITGDDTDYDLSDYIGKNFNAEEWANGIKMTVDDFVTNLGDIKDSTVSWWEDRKNDWTEGMNIISSTVSEKMEGIKNDWSDGIDIIKSETTQWWEDRKNDWTTGMSIISSTVSEKAEKVKNYFGDMTEKVKNKTVPWLNERVSDWRTGMSSIANSVSDKMGAVKNFFSNGMENMKDSFSNFWNNHASKWFSSSKWNFTGIKDGLTSAFDAAIGGVKQIWNKFANWLNDKLTWEIKPVKVMGKTIFEGTTINLGKIPTFATGGFPEDGLFFANSRELVGKFSNGKTAVANNGQITEGIEAAAYNGMKRALSEGGYNRGSNVNISLEANTEGLFKVVKKEADNYTRSTGQSAFAF